ncbi:radical SAM family RiPP maturation amino acid epimerase [Methylobacter sp.]|uniref:radical SAM family RiPP maturation amino acid epimerase n=1 Tax=Methylobacter sp. TaxID=2051955 RepID=UPI002FDE9826
MMHPLSEASLHYRNIFTSRTEQELETISKIKRFMERFSADEVFRKRLQENHLNPHLILAEYGLEIDLQRALPLWHDQYSKYRFKTNQEQKWPLADMFDRYINDMRKYRALIREQGDMSQSYPRFHSWRERQIARSASEIPGNYEAITHSIISFELSQGCSVGCWFCGISADKFTGYYPYDTENVQLWRAMLQVVYELFGEAAHTGFCYWATDPCDNPDYAAFINDYYQVMGCLPQTTTATPLKNLELTRKILHLSEQHRCTKNRFSVISLRLLNQIHQTFTARELLDVELVMQNKESLTLKTVAGRASERQERFRKSGRNDENLKLKRDHSTIACVSGFLVSMLKKTIQLIAPTRACEKWPLGYRIYAERQFTNSETFRTALVEMIDEFMPDSLPDGNLVSFRKDLTFSVVPEGDESSFYLKSKWVKHTCKGFSFMRLLGELIASGSYCVDTLTAQLVEAGADAGQTKNTLQHLYDKSLLNDEPDYA